MSHVPSADMASSQSASAYDSQDGHSRAHHPLQEESVLTEAISAEMLLFPAVFPPTVKKRG